MTSQKRDLASLLARPPARANVGAVKAALSAAQPAMAFSRGKRLDFIVDCTGSRAPQWQEVQAITGDLLGAAFANSASQLRLGLTVFRGGQTQHVGCFTQGPEAKQAMAQISCLSGETKLRPATAMCLGLEPESQKAAVIFIGDHCEERDADITALIADLREHGVVAHAFHDASQRHEFDGSLSESTVRGGQVYRRIAEETGGIFAVLGEQASLPELCLATVTLAIDGPEAYRRLLASGHKGAKAIASQVNRPALGYNGK